jgi:hypothetical protein
MFFCPPNCSTETSTCPCSTNLLLHSTVGMHSLKNMLTEKFQIFASRIICFLQNMANLLCTVVESLNCGFSEQNVHVSLVFNYVREIRSCPV